MTIEDIYGTRPDLLPRTVVRPICSVETSGKSISWVGRDGIELLDLSDHLVFERQSLGRLPRADDGNVEWDKMDEASVLDVGDLTAAMLTRVGDEWISDLEEYVFFWGVLAAPSAMVQGLVARELLVTTSEEFPDFWVFCPARSILIESSFAGRVTVARLGAS